MEFPYRGAVQILKQPRRPPVPEWLVNGESIADGPPPLPKRPAILSQFDLLDALAEKLLEGSPVVARARLLDALRRDSSERTAACRCNRLGDIVGYQLTASGSVLALGFETCRSVWACPVCATKIYKLRAAYVTKACKQWRDEGCFVYLVTSTIRHEWDTDLQLLRRKLGHAWSRIWTGKKGKARVEYLGKVYHCRAIEVTHGKNGFHPHLHALLFVTKELTPEDHQGLRDAWNQAVRKELGEKYVPDDEHGVVLDHSQRSDYIAKLGLEIADITSKQARNGNRTMWQVAAHAAVGDESSRAIWRTYTKAMKGARQLCWSKGAKNYFGIDDSKDEEGAVDEPDKTPVREMLFDAETYDEAKRKNPRFMSDMVAALKGDAVAVAKVPKQYEGLERPADWSEVQRREYPETESDNKRRGSGNMPTGKGPRVLGGTAPRLLTDAQVRINRIDREVAALPESLQSQRRNEKLAELRESMSIQRREQELAKLRQRLKEAELREFANAGDLDEAMPETENNLLFAEYLLR